MGPDGANKEQEIKLIIIGDNRQRVLEDLASLEIIGSYGFGRGKRIVLRDQYFAVKGAPGKYALRLRKSDGFLLLALKGPALVNEWGALERLEIEGQWSKELLKRILNAHAPENAQTELCKMEFGSLKPKDLLVRLGFELIQDRRSTRVQRDIFILESESIIGEMAIDLVSYELKGFVVNHYELELELKGQGRGTDLATISKLLQKKYAKDLARWPHDKLTTGLAMERMFQDRFLIKQNQESQITAEMYERMSKAIDCA